MEHLRDTRREIILSLTPQEVEVHYLAFIHNYLFFLNQCIFPFFYDYSESNLVNPFFSNLTTHNASIL